MLPGSRAGEHALPGHANDYPSAGRFGSGRPILLTVSPHRILFLFAVLLLAPVAAPPGAASEADGLGVLRPGDPVETPVGFCTLNFAFEDARGERYLGTAGHCVEGAGTRVKTDGESWGTVVLDLDNPDFALVRVDASRRAIVRADVEHWGGPTGVATFSETSAGDLVAFYGYGVGFEFTDATRARQGVLVSDTSTRFQSDMPAVFGDSGGPIIMKSTGKALGVVSQFGTVTTDEGPTMDYIMRTLHARGFQVRLLTAAYDAPLV